MEIDPEANEMWIIDVGRRNIWNATEATANCPPKLVILDLDNGDIIKAYNFSDNVLSHNKNFVNDIVIDPDSGYAYMTDVGEGPGSPGHRGGIVVYNRRTGEAHRHEHDSMQSEEDGKNITINGEVYVNDVPSDGIALSADRTQLYYCALGGYHLWQMPASSARDSSANLDNVVRDLGRKASQTDGMLMGHKHLYFGALSMNAVYQWEHSKDMEYQNTTLASVNMTTQTQLVQNNVSMIWADTFSLDVDGWLWMTVNQLPLFRAGKLDFTGTQPNFAISKIQVDDMSYLEPESRPTTDPSNSATSKVHSWCLGLMTLLITIMSFKFVKAYWLLYTSLDDTLNKNIL